MTKSARIRELYAQGISVRNIAKLVGCSPERGCEQKPVHVHSGYGTGFMPGGGSPVPLISFEIWVQ